MYTFDFYQHLYNAVTFELDLGFRKVKLADYLNHQPAQVHHECDMVDILTPGIQYSTFDTSQVPAYDIRPSIFDETMG